MEIVLKLISLPPDYPSRWVHVSTDIRVIVTKLHLILPCCFLKASGCWLHRASSLRFKFLSFMHTSSFMIGPLPNTLSFFSLPSYPLSPGKFEFFNFLEHIMLFQTTSLHLLPLLPDDSSIHPPTAWASSCLSSLQTWFTRSLFWEVFFWLLGLVSSALCLCFFK